MNIPTGHQPPRGFKPAGSVSFAQLDRDPGFHTRRNRTLSGAKAAGVRYERKVTKELCGQHPDHYAPGPWLKYWRRRRAKPMWCEPDGLFVDLSLGICFICEVKLAHTARAWWQVRELYTPVMAKILGPDWRIGGVEVCHHADPSVRCPEEPHFIDTLWDARLDKWNILLLRI